MGREETPRFCFQKLTLAAGWKMDWKGGNRGREGRGRLCFLLPLSNGDGLDWGGGGRDAEKAVDS